MNKTKVKNLVTVIGISIITVIISLSLIVNDIIDLNKLTSFIDNSNYDFQYNMFGASAIIAGFLFSSIGMLISAIDEPRIQRLWKHNYLNNLYVFAFEGMISNIITIICAFVIITVSLPDKIIKSMIYLEIITLFLGIVSFIVCVRYLIFIIRTLKNDSSSD